MVCSRVALSNGSGNALRLTLSSPVVPRTHPCLAVISVILPCLNEMRHGYLTRILDNLVQQTGEKEIIAVVSPSQDDTLAAIAQYPAVQLIQAAAQNRAQRLNIGIAASQGDILLLHHPATLLPARTALQTLETALAQSGCVWGGFRHRFDLDHWLLRFTSWYSTEYRGKRGGILYLDHCIFVRRSVLLDLGGVPELDIFEDTALSQNLRRYSPPCLAEDSILTSARRFRDRGVIQHALLNQLLKLCYHLGLDPRHLNWLYERKSQINVRYK